MNRRRFLQSTALAVASVSSLPQTWAASPGLRPDARDGMLRVKGQREFILGLYQVPKRDGALAQAAQAGFNLINRGMDRAAFDEAHRLGLWGWTSTGTLPDGAERAAAEKRLRGQIEALRDHPALLFWETEDEPSYVWKEPLKLRVPPARIVETARFVRQVDPGHPLYLNHSPTQLIPTLQAYNEASDLVAMDIYPVIPHGIRDMYALWADGRQGDLLNNTISQMGPYTDKMRAVAGPKRAVLMVQQAFAWEDLREKDRDPAMVLYPTRAQLRFMAWQAVVHGANGLIWWGLAYLPASAGLWDDLRAVVKELAQVRPALSAPALHRKLKLTYTETGHSLDRGVEWMLKPLGRETLLIAVNADPNPVDVTFAGFGRLTECRPLFEERTVSWQEGRLRELFEPFGTRVWRLS